MSVRPIRAFVGAAVALLVVSGSAGLGSVQGAPTLHLVPSTIAAGGFFSADLLSYSPGTYFFEVSNTSLGMSSATCASLIAFAELQAPSTPGTYTVVVKDRQLNEVASATLTVTGAIPGPNPAAICAQAIAEAGTGAGKYGSYTLVQAPAQGRSGRQVVVGTEGDDLVVGGSGNDVLCGLGGDDVLVGGSGTDHLDGGAGTDALNSGSGNDTLINGESNH